MSDEKTLSQARRKNLNNGTGRHASRNMKGKALANKQRNLAQIEADKANGAVDSSLPANGHTTDMDAAKRNTFTKQESQASSSGATAEANLLNDSLITNESSLTNQSFVTSLSGAAQTDKSVGADSTNSVQSAQSSSEIKVSSEI